MTTQKTAKDSLEIPSQLSAAKMTAKGRRQGKEWGGNAVTESVASN